MSAAETISNDDGLLVLKECPDCDYSLVGLTRDGKCPECGRNYGQKVVILHGWGRGRHATISTAPPRLTAGLAALAALPISYLIVAYLFLPGRNNANVLVVIVLSLIVLFPLLRRRTGAGGVGPSEARLSAYGCSQAIRKSHQPTGLARLFSGDQAPCIHTPIPWSIIVRVRLKGDAKRRRLRCDVGPWWNRASPVDFEFIASPADAATLQSRIEGWRADAKDHPGTPADHLE